MLWWTSRRLEKQLQSGLAHIRNDAFRELASHTSPGSTKLLVHYVENRANPSKERAKAIDALSHRREAASVTVLIRLLEDRERESYLNRCAADALGAVGDPAAVEPLLRAAERSDLQHSAALALGRIGNVRAVPVLLRELGNACAEAAASLDKIDPEWRDRPEVADVANTLINSLVKCGREAGRALDAIDKNWRNGVAARAAIPVVLATLETNVSGPSRDPRLICNAAWAIGEIGDVAGRQVIPLLAKALQLLRESEMERSVTATLEKLAPEYVGPESREAADLLKKLTLPSLEWAEQANLIDDLQRLLEHSASRIRSDILQRIAAMKREVIRYHINTTVDDEPYIVPGEIDTNRCVDLAHGELFFRR